MSTANVPPKNQLLKDFVGFSLKQRELRSILSVSLSRTLLENLALAYSLVKTNGLIVDELHWDDKRC